MAKGSATVDGRGGVLITGGVIKKVGTVAVNPPNIAATATGTIDVTIAGAQVGDAVVMIPPNSYGSTDGINGDDHIVFMGAAVTADDTVQLRFSNVYSAGEAQDGPSRTWQYLLIGA